jgi:hypothetical protein
MYFIEASLFKTGFNKRVDFDMRAERHIHIVAICQVCQNVTNDTIKIVVSE